MLTHLSIKNYALIAFSSIDFSNQLSIITGETGAGKSILLDALGLVLGKRADLNALRDKENKCVVEAHFSISNYNLNVFFDENDLDYDDATVLRREILPSGKSRAFINDSPVTLAVLQELGTFLLDIHSQHQTQDLSSENHQIQILDAVANNQNLVLKYQQILSEYKVNKKKLLELQEEQKALSKEQDYNSFLLDELIAANLNSGEQEILESELEKLSNVEFVHEHFEKSAAILSDEQYGIINLLKELKTSLQKISPIDSAYHDLFERVQSAEIELKDVLDEVENQSEKLVKDPVQLELINGKLQQIYALQKKHFVNTIDELLAIQEDLNSKVFKVEGISEAIEKLLQAESVFENQLNEIASQIRNNRELIIPKLIEEIRAIISPLGMPNANFKFELTPTDKFLSNGKDHIEWLFSANKGMDFGILKKTASGGEMSRIMLAIKAILAKYSHLPTIIFDEIDTGVSGDVANKMGEIMKEMSKNMQVMAITHLPQVASKGHQHFKVSKDHNSEQTVSEIKLLSTEDRIKEIAQMLSGENITDSAISHAKELLN
ncbi:DNA repair protein RecN [Paenimyroides tangerinum]|uniref:DNA repair protein RecN n=1 Tax=Paenimyroides tangerinum TaxID=2488728 RepID=A0A3P3WED8_9FLAO|nr:DNA repair protein RecN [Paenimyroides tangerinum]RRJ92009.1 DNA repair protein RecN [Paenimyroides tangerinum]